MNKSLCKIFFFNGYFELLEARGISSVILHTYAAYPEHIHSDIDYCVSGEDLPQVIPLVYEHCLNSGWRLVQIMQHEPKAYFCICVSKQDPSQYIELDVCSDYMREGRVLIDADDLLKKRSRIEPKHFHIPSPGAEFCYCLWKSVAKKKSTQMMFDQLNTLYDRNPEQCSNAMVDLGILESHQNAKNWKTQGEEIYADLLLRYDQMPVSSKKSQIHRLYRRVMNPSGLVIWLPPKESRKEVDAVLNACRHAFRKTTSNSGSLSGTWKSILRSTLVFYEAKGIKHRVIGILGAYFDAGFQLKSGSNNQMTNQIFDYLEARLVKRWMLGKGN